jgi:hypothetical protein
VSLLTSLPKELLTKVLRKVTYTMRKQGEPFGEIFNNRSLRPCFLLRNENSSSLVILFAGEMQLCPPAASGSLSAKVSKRVQAFNHKFRFPPYDKLPPHVLAAPRASQLSLVNARFAILPDAVSTWRSAPDIRRNAGCRCRKLLAEDMPTPASRSATWKSCSCCDKDLQAHAAKLRDLRRMLKAQYDNLNAARKRVSDLTKLKPELKSAVEEHRL